VVNRLQELNGLDNLRMTCQHLQLILETMKVHVFSMPRELTNTEFMDNICKY